MLSSLIRMLLSVGVILPIFLKMSREAVREGGQQEFKDGVTEGF
jgi:hypothetical protein